MLCSYTVGVWEHMMYKRGCLLRFQPFVRVWRGQHTPQTREDDAAQQHKQAWILGRRRQQTLRSRHAIMIKTVISQHSTQRSTHTRWCFRVLSPGLVALGAGSTSCPRRAAHGRARRRSGRSRTRCRRPRPPSCTAHCVGGTAIRQAFAASGTDRNRDISPGGCLSWSGKWCPIPGRTC